VPFLPPSCCIGPAQDPPLLHWPSADHMFGATGDPRLEGFSPHREDIGFFACHRFSLTRVSQSKRDHQPFNQLFEGFKVRGLIVVGSMMFAVSPPLGCPEHQCIADLNGSRTGESSRTVSAGFLTAAVIGKVPPSTSEVGRQGEARRGEARRGEARRGEARRLGSGLNPAARSF
jgi:hypothetical protein